MGTGLGHSVKEVLNSFKKMSGISIKHEICPRRSGDVAISYTDVKKSKNQTLEDVAKDFESLFVYQMMKSSRKAKLAEGVLSNSANDTYFSLLDQEYSKIISKNQSFGIAEALVRQFGEKKVK